MQDVRNAGALPDYDTVRQTCLIAQPFDVGFRELLALAQVRNPLI